MVNPYAAFDSLYISAALGTNIRRPVVAEIHAFAYLACLLSLYRGQPVSDWGYGFAGTRDGSPFSPEIEGAVRAMASTGYLHVSEGDIGITAGGQNCRHSRNCSKIANALRTLSLLAQAA